MNTSLYPPQKIRLHKQQAELEIIWQSGNRCRIPGSQLRRYCACSTCRAKQLVGIQLISDSAEINSIALMSNTGLQIVFADGHDRGIYPWDYLDAIARGIAQRYFDS